MEWKATKAKKSQASFPLTLVVGGAILLVLGIVIPTNVLADPHAMFYTDRAQAQLFYNVLAALNQADYVEDPDTPEIAADQRFGEFIRTGEYQPDLMFITPLEFDTDTGRIRISDALEPNEQQDVELPRIRVRQVTSDDGDVYYRERLERRALSEEIRSILAFVACKNMELIYGPQGDSSESLCKPQPR